MSQAPAFYPPGGTIDSRRQVLAGVDNALWSWFHIRVCAVAGVGFFTDAYDLFAINIAASMLHHVYNTSPEADLGLKISRYGGRVFLRRRMLRGLSAFFWLHSSVGSLFGQILFGWLADVFGRKRIYGLELCVMIVGSLAQAVAGHAKAVSLVGVLVMWRFVMGIGVGGDYPSSAVISSEFAPTRTRGRIMTSVFATQGLGNLAASVVALVVIEAFGPAIRAEATVGENSHIDFCWRLLIGLGCVPGAIALYFRLTISETPRFTIDVLQNVQQALNDVNYFIGKLEDEERGEAYVVHPDAPIERLQVAPDASSSDFFNYFSRWSNLSVLFGASYSWFALDVAFYGLGLNSSIVIQAIFKDSSNLTCGDSLPGYDIIKSLNQTSGPEAFQSLKQISIGNIVLSVAGLIPGYILAFCFIDVIGRKRMQLMGFSVSSVLFFIMGGVYSKSSVTQSRRIGFAALYCLAELFQNFGPNTSTFVIPGEAFPTRYRSTAFGICAAAGKTGAIVAQVIFFSLDTRGSNSGRKDCSLSPLQVSHLVFVLGGFMVTGIFSTLLLPETMGKSLEENSNEDQAMYMRERTNPNVGSVSSL